MLPVVVPGQTSSSLAPPWYESSFCPDARSFCRASLTDAQSIDGAGSSALRFALVSISKLLPGKLASGWLAIAGKAKRSPAARATNDAARPILRRRRRNCLRTAVMYVLPPLGDEQHPARGRARSICTSVSSVIDPPRKVARRKTGNPKGQFPGLRRGSFPDLAHRVPHRVNEPPVLGNATRWGGF